MENKENKSIGNINNNMPDTWFPCFNGITKDLGVITSAVFGNIWSKCNYLGFSFASQNTISKELGLGKNTVIRSLKELLSKKLILQLDQSKLIRPKNIDPRTRSYVANIEVYKKLYPYENKDAPNKNSYTEINQKNLESYVL